MSKETPSPWRDIQPNSLTFAIAHKYHQEMQALPLATRNDVLQNLIQAIKDDEIREGQRNANEQEQKQPSPCTDHNRQQPSRNLQHLFEHEALKSENAVPTPARKRKGLANETVINVDEDEETHVTYNEHGDESIDDGLDDSVDDNDNNNNEKAIRQTSRQDVYTLIQEAGIENALLPLNQTATLLNSPGTAVYYAMHLIGFKINDGIKFGLALKGAKTLIDCFINIRHTYTRFVAEPVTDQNKTPGRLFGTIPRRNQSNLNNKDPNKLWTITELTYSQQERGYVIHQNFVFVAGSEHTYKTSKTWRTYADNLTNLAPTGICLKTTTDLYHNRIASWTYKYKGNNRARPVTVGDSYYIYRIPKTPKKLRTPTK